MKADGLTPGQQKALVAVAYGVRKLKGGYYREDDPTSTVDGRSLQALVNKGLIYSYSSGGMPQLIFLQLTEEGSRIFEKELRWKNL